MTNNVPSPHIFETTAESFAREVIERSMDLPVVVDFWAEWCGPCKVLGPILERLAIEYDGRFLLAKAETENQPEIASGFGVRSIPAVFAVREGQVVDSFVGVLPESSIRAWLDGIMPTPAELLRAEARILEATDPEAAGAKYREAIALVPDDPAAKVGLGRVALESGRFEEARSIVEALERRGFLEPEAETLKAGLTLRGRGDATDDLGSLRAAHAATPADKDLQLRLAERLAAAGESEEALRLALDLVERDRRGVGEPARKLMVAIFQLLPPDSGLANDYRRQLSLAL